MSELTQFQDAFSAALRGNGNRLRWWMSDPSDVGLSVYRNTVAAGAVDALAASFPTVVQIVGAEWFRAAAAAYARERAPTKPSLVDYGEDFPEWLASFPPARDTPYLASIARIDRLWWDAYFADDAEHLAPSAVVGLAEADLASAALRLHPSVRLARFDETVVSLWLTHQEPSRTAEGFQIEVRPECLLIARRGLDVTAQLVDLATLELLWACLLGRPLMSAAALASEADPSASLPAILSLCFRAGAFSRLDQGTGDRTS